MTYACTVGVSTSQNTNKSPTTNPSNAPVHLKITLLGKALFVSGKPPIPVFPAFEAVLVVDGINDGPMTVCEITIVVDVLVAIEPPEVFGVLEAVPVGIVRDGKPVVTIRHLVSNARNDKA